MPPALTERRNTDPLKNEAEGLLRDVIGDFVTRIKLAPVGTVAFTGLNLLSSMIPSASFILSDAIIARAVQRYVDPKFKLTYDSETGKVNPGQIKELYLRMLELGAGNPEEQVRAQKALGFIRDRAFLNGHTPNPLQGQILLNTLFKKKIESTHFSNAASFISTQPSGIGAIMHRINAAGFTRVHRRERAAHEKARIIMSKAKVTGSKQVLHGNWNQRSPPTADRAVLDRVKRFVSRRSK